jgi:hypothetical protein
LYNSGITSDIIALQIDDVSQQEVDKIIENAGIEQEERKKDIYQTNIKYFLRWFFLSWCSSKYQLSHQTSTD